MGRVDEGESARAVGEKKEGEVVDEVTRVAVGEYGNCYGELICEEDFERG